MSFLVPNRGSIQRRTSANFSAGFTFAAVGNAVPPGRAGATISMASDFAPKGRARVESGATISTTMTLTATGVASSGGGSPVTETWGENTADTHKSVTFDTRLNETSPTTNYGTNDSLFIEGTVVGDPGESSVLRYDISALLSNAQITSAKLKFTYRRASPPASQALVHVFRGLRNDFVVTEATWNLYKSGSSWTAPGAKGSGSDVSGDPAAQTGMLGTITIPAGTVQDTVFELGITAEVQARFAAGQPVNIALHPDPTNGEHIVFGSSRATDGFRPVLEITGTNLSNGSSGGGGEPTGPGATGIYFVHTDGRIYDPQGNLFIPRGCCMEHNKLPSATNLTYMGDPGWRMNFIRILHLTMGTTETWSDSLQDLTEDYIVDGEKVACWSYGQQVGNIPVTSNPPGPTNLNTLRNRVTNLANIFGTGKPKANERLWYELYNELGSFNNDGDADFINGQVEWDSARVTTWKNFLTAMITAIRGTGAKAPIIIPSMVGCSDIARTSGGNSFTRPVTERSSILSFCQDILNAAPDVVANGKTTKNLIFKLHVYKTYQGGTPGALGSQGKDGGLDVLREFFEAAKTAGPGGDGIAIQVQEYGLFINSTVNSRDATRNLHALSFPYEGYTFGTAVWQWDGGDSNNLTETDGGCELPSGSSSAGDPDLPPAQQKCGTCPGVAQGAVTGRCSGPDINSLTNPTNLTVSGKAAWDMTHPGSFLPGSF